MPEALGEEALQNRVTEVGEMNIFLSDLKNRLSQCQKYRVVQKYSCQLPGVSVWNVAL